MKWVTSTSRNGMALSDTNPAMTTTVVVGMEVKVVNKVVNTRRSLQGLVVCKSSEVCVIGVMVF